MKVKIFQSSDCKITYSDDLVKVVKFFKDKINLDVEFSAPILTDVKLIEAPWNLYLPNDNGQQEILMYIFDREQRSNSFALNFSKTLQCVEISTSVADDGVDYTWKLIAHELVHCLFHKLRNINIFLNDPMDLMEINGQWIPYYQNENPYSPNGNFAEAFKRLSPHLSKIFKPTYKYFSQAEVDKWKLEPIMWEKLDLARGHAGIPFRINSGRRTEAQNEGVGGVNDSSHLKGLGVDLRAITSREHYLITKGLILAGFRRISRKYPLHIHADLDSDKEQDVLF